jgi:hypothetical protein
MYTCILSGAGGVTLQDQINSYIISERVMNPVASHINMDIIYMYVTVLTYRNKKGIFISVESVPCH